MMAHVTGAEFFLKAERKALGGDKTVRAGVASQKKKKCSVAGGTGGRAQSRESLVCPFNSLIVGGGNTVVGIRELAQKVKALAD